MIITFSFDYITYSGPNADATAGAVVSLCDDCVVFCTSLRMSVVELTQVGQWGMGGKSTTIVQK